MSNAKDREDKSNQHDTASAVELICTQCGDRYIVRYNDETPSLHRHHPGKCYKCRRVVRKRREKEKEERENQLWQQRKPSAPVIPTVTDLDEIRKIVAKRKK